MAKATLNPLTDTPSKMTDLTKSFMLAYIKSKGTKADKEWFQKLVEKYTIDKINKLNGQKCKGISDISKMRIDFATRFFPQLIKSKDSFFDEVNNLI